MRHKSIIIAMLLTLLTGACDSVDCSLNNTVFCYISFYNGEGQKVAISDTLSIYAHGTDQVLFNRGVGKSDIAIPMSYYNEEDTLTFMVWNNEYSLEAEIAVNKTNTEHFESPDCPAKMFHNINYAYIYGGNIIDSVVVVKPSVNYQRDENIRIYLH